MPHVDMNWEFNTNHLNVFAGAAGFLEIFSFTVKLVNKLN